MARILLFDSAAANYSDGTPLPGDCKGYSEDSETPKYSAPMRMVSADGEERVCGIELALDIGGDLTDSYVLNFYMLYYDDSPGLGWPPPRPNETKPTDKWPPRFPRIPNSWASVQIPMRWMREVSEVTSSTDGTVNHYQVTRVLTLGGAAADFLRRAYLPLAVHSRWCAVAHWWTTAPVDTTRFYIYGHIGGHAEEAFVEDNPTNGPYNYEIYKPA